MLGITLRDKIINAWIRERMQARDITMSIEVKLHKICDGYKRWRLVGKNNSGVLVKVGNAPEEMSNRA